MKKALVCLLAVALLAFACAAIAEEETVTITVMDANENVLNEVEVPKGTVVTAEDLGVSREGYVLEGIYVTPAMLRAYDNSPIEADTPLFVAFQSAQVDERPWMLAGSLRGYPDNAWGKVWPQDDYLFQPVEGEFNTFAIEVNLYKDDEFKIAVIGEGYAWSETDILDSRNVVPSEYLSGGEDAFDTGANIKVLQDGLYRLTLVTDAETIALCEISAERIGEAAPPPEVEYVFDLQVHGSFLGNWDVAQNVTLTRNGDEYLWYGVFDVAEAGEFGVKNYGTEAWFAAPDGANIQVEPGHYMIFVRLTEDNQLAEPILWGEPAYYVVGTCGNKGWAADANADNTAYAMQAQEDGTYALAVTFTEDDTDTWTEGQVAFKVAYGLGGLVGNDYWYGDAEGNNIMVAPGEYTIVFDPATGTVTVE